MKQEKKGQLWTCICIFATLKQFLSMRKQTCTFQKQINDLYKKHKVQGSFISHYLYKVNMEEKYGYNTWLQDKIITIQGPVVQSSIKLNQG